MRTVILKPFLLVTLLFATAFITMNAGQYIGGGEIKIELRPGFTIEDIIQDLHDNSSIDINIGSVNGAVVTLKFDAKIVNKEVLIQILEAHPGVDVIYYKMNK